MYAAAVTYTHTYIQTPSSVCYDDSTNPQQPCRMTRKRFTLEVSIIWQQQLLFNRHYCLRMRCTAVLVSPTEVCVPTGNT